MNWYYVFEIIDKPSYSVENILTYLFGKFNKNEYIKQHLKVCSVSKQLHKVLNLFYGVITSYEVTYKFLHKMSFLLLFSFRNDNAYFYFIVSIWQRDASVFYISLCLGFGCSVLCELLLFCHIQASGCQYKRNYFNLTLVQEIWMTRW